MKKIKPIYPKSTCYGITNKCADGKYVLFADFDGIYFADLLKAVDQLIERHKVFSNFIILESSDPVHTKDGILGSYHLVNFAKLPYQKVREVLSELPVDKEFYDALCYTPYRSNTLRHSPKFKWKTDEVIKAAPRFICFYPADKPLEPVGELSSAHFKAYKHFFSLPECLSLYGKFDLLGEIELKRYDSGKE